MPDIPVYYINVASRTDRRDFMEAQLAALGLSFERIEAVTTEDLTPEDLSRYCDPRRFTAKTPAELCCSLSHLKAWRSFADAGYESALILEDDVILSERLPDLLTSVGGQPFDVIRIEAATRGADVDGWKLLTSDPLASLAGGIALRAFRSSARGCAAYIITGAGVGKFNASTGMLDLPHDVAMFDPLAGPSTGVNIVQTDPALAIQLGHAAAYRASPLASSSIPTIRQQPRTLIRLLSDGWRELHHGVIKGVELITRRDLKRREIAFAGDTGFVDAYIKDHMS